MLNIKMEKVGDELHVGLEGRLNNMTAKDCGQQIQSELDNVRRVVLDFANLEYISSAGLRVLVALQVHMEKSGGEDVCVRNATGIVLETLEIAGFRGVINFE